MSEKELRSKVIRLAHSNPELREHLLPLVKSASGTSWGDHTRKWFEDLGKLIVKYSNKEIEIRNISVNGLTFNYGRIYSDFERGLNTGAMLKFTRYHTFDFYMVGKLEKNFSKSQSMGEIARAIAKLINNSDK